MRVLNQILTIILIVGIFFVWSFVIISPDSVNVQMEKSYFSEYKSCESDLSDMNENFKEISELKKVTCNCLESKLNLFASLWAFFIGAISCGYFIVVGYPWLQKKLEKKDAN